MTLGIRRIVAWLIDWTCILIWVAATAAVGVPLYLNGIITPTGMVMANLVGAFVIVIPVVIAAAYCESREVAATPGKKVLGLHVLARSKSPRFRVAMVRNLLKLGVPWLLGHTVVFAIVTSSSGAHGVPTGVWILTAAAYILPIIYVISLFIADGRVPYDRITGTDVRPRPEPAS